MKHTAQSLGMLRDAVSSSDLCGRTSTLQTRALSLRLRPTNHDHEGNLLWRLILKYQNDHRRTKIQDSEPCVSSVPDTRKVR